MAKLRTDPIDRDDIMEYLNTQSDFSFELEVLKMLRDKGITCEHGGHYEDPVTGKSREFDIRAVVTHTPRRVRMAIECKNIREHFPVLVSCIPRHIQESFHEVAHLENRNAGNPILEAHESRASVFRPTGPDSIYKPGIPVGKSTVQVGRLDHNGDITANDSELYDKWGQCLSSADQLVARMYYDGSQDEVTFFSAVFPIVVVPNGRLWVRPYDEDGEPTGNPTRRNHCSCFIGKDYEMGPAPLVHSTYRVSHMEIMTIAGLERFVDDHLLSEASITQLLGI